MGHKVLQDHAYVFCQMFMGWRMADDLEAFSHLPDGQMYINVLDGTCEHTVVGRLNTHIAGEIREWFLHRLSEHGIPLQDIVKASLKVRMKNTIHSGHKRGFTFDWTCDGMISAKDREYTAHLAEPHTWLPMPLG